VQVNVASHRRLRGVVGEDISVGTFAAVAQQPIEPSHQNAHLSYQSYGSPRGLQFSSVK